MALVTQDAIPTTGLSAKKPTPKKNNSKIQQKLTSPPSMGGDDFKNNDNRIAWHSTKHSHPLNNGLGDIQFGKGIPNKTELTNWTIGTTTIDYTPISSRYNSSKIQSNLGDSVYEIISAEAQRRASGPRTAAYFSEPHIIKRPHEAPAQEGKVATAVNLVKGMADFMGLKLSLKDAYAYGRHTLSPRGLLFLANETALTKRILGAAYEGPKTFRETLGSYSPSAIITKLKTGNTFNPLGIYASRVLGGVGARGIRNYRNKGEGLTGMLAPTVVLYSDDLQTGEDDIEKAYQTNIGLHEHYADITPHIRKKSFTNTERPYVDEPFMEQNGPMSWLGIVTNRNDLSKWWTKRIRQSQRNVIDAVSTDEDVSVNADGVEPVGSDFTDHKIMQDITPSHESMETPFTMKANEDGETLHTRGGEELVDKYRAHLYGGIVAARNDRSKWTSQRTIEVDGQPKKVEIQTSYGVSGRPNPGGKYEGDKINLLEIQQLNDDGTEPVTGVHDLIPFKIKILNTNQMIILRAYIDDISDTITPDWSEINYVGRPDPVHVYKGAKRQFSLKFKLIPNSKAEHKILWEKANTLVGLNYPTYASLGNTETNASLGNRMVAPFIKLTVGDIIHDQAGYFSGINVSSIDNSPWELTPGQRLPMYIEVSATFVFIGNHLPDLGNPKFYNIDNLQQ